MFWKYLKCHCLLNQQAFHLPKLIPLYIDSAKKSVSLFCFHFKSNLFVGCSGIRLRTAVRNVFKTAGQEIQPIIVSISACYLHYRKLYQK